MIERFGILAAASIGLMVTAAYAEPQETPDAPKARLICRGAARELGSHIMPTRRCRTAEQWRIEDEAKAQRPLSLQVTQGQNDGQVSRTPQ